MLTSKDSTLLLAVLNHGMATNFCKSAARIRDTGHTIFLGHGTASSKWLQWLGIDEVKKEIAMLLIPKEDEEQFFGMALNEYKMNEKNTGILVSIDILRFFGMADIEMRQTEIVKEENVAYKAIFVITEKGIAEDVMEVAEKAGARGGTVIHARGAGIHEQEVLFNIQVEPEKEILMIIAETQHAVQIVQTINEAFKIEEPGNGMLFVMDVSQAVGMVKNRDGAVQ